MGAGRNGSEEREDTGKPSRWPVTGKSVYGRGVWCLVNEKKNRKWGYSEGGGGPSEDLAMTRKMVWGSWGFQLEARGAIEDSAFSWIQRT